MTTYLVWLTTLAIDQGAVFDTPPLQCTLFQKFDWDRPEEELVHALQPVFKRASSLTLIGGNTANTFGPKKDKLVRLVRRTKALHILHLEVYKVLQRFQADRHIHNPKWAGIEGYRPHVTRNGDQWLLKGERMTVHYAHLIKEHPRGWKEIVAQFPLGS